MNIKSLSSGRTSPIFGRILSVSGGGGKYFYSITSLNPSLVAVGSPDTVVSIFGGIFTGTSVPYINGTPAAVYSLISPTQIDVTVPASVLATPGVDIIRVRDSLNPTTNFSNAVLLGTAYPLPTLTNHVPASVPQGSPDTTITLTGTGFYPSGTFVDVNDAPYTFAYLSPTSGTFVFPATLAAAVGSYSITVVNPAPGGGVSASRNLTVNPSVGVLLSAIAPTGATQHDNFVSLTLTGAGFTASSVAYADATPLATTYVSPTQLTATITSGVGGILGTSGAKAITVVDPGGTSGAQTFTVTAWSVLDIATITAAYKATNVLTSGSAVTQLTDRTGNGRHLSQGIGAKQGQLVSSDASFSNKPSVLFDGVDDAYVGLAISNYYTAATWAMVCVYKIDAFVGVAGAFQQPSLFASNNGQLGVSCRTGPNQLNPYAYDGVYKTMSVTAGVSTNPSWCHFTHSGGLGSFTVNSGTATTLASGNLTALASNFTLGTGTAGFLNGRFAEGFTCNGPLTAAELIRVKHYIAFEYGIV